VSNILVGVGQYMNLLNLAKLVTISAPDAQLVAANLFDGLPTRPGRTTNVTALFVTVDFDHIQNQNGGFANWTGGSPVGITKVTSGSGTVTQVNPAGGAHSGASCAKLFRNNVADNAYVLLDFLVPSGSYWLPDCWTYDGNLQSNVAVQNLDTGNYLTSFITGGIPAGAYQTWTGGVTDPAHASSLMTLGAGSGAWGENKAVVPIRVEPYSVTRKDLTRIRVYLGLFSDSSGPNPITTYLDDFGLWCDPFFSSVHYHNLPVGAVVKIQSSPDSSTWTDQVTLQVAPQSFWGQWARAHTRYLRFNAQPVAQGGTPDGFLDGAAWLGELTFVQPDTLAMHEMMDGQARGRSFDQVRDDRGLFAYPLATQAMRDRPLSFEPLGPDGGGTELFEFEEMLVDRSLSGAYPLVVVPDDTKPDVYFGRIPPQNSVSRNSYPRFKGMLALQEFPPPVV
jgi:hypothetical protein